MNLTAPAPRCNPLRLPFEEVLAPEETTILGTQAMTLPACKPRARVHASEGMLWITEEGDRNDYIVGAGEEFVSSGLGRVVVEGLAAESRFVVRVAA